MVENKSKQLVDFFDTDHLGNYKSDLLEINFDVAIEQKHYLVSVDEIFKSLLNL